VLRPLALLVLVGCPKAPVETPAPPPAPPTDELSALVWIQTAAEHDAASLTAYHAAASALDRALADPTWTAAVEQTGDFAKLPPAVIVDVDETVLDNSPYQARLALDGTSFDPGTWNQWVADAKGRAIAGAAEFLTLARGKGVDVYYVSNRSADQQEPTRKNLADLGFPDTADLQHFLFRPADGPAAKTVRRAEIAKTHRIVMLFGDNLFDFVEADPPPDLAARDALVTTHLDWWGTRWFVVPNPLYGSWDDVLVGYGHPPADQRHEARKKALDPAR
jgi:acid phosphatase